LLAITRKFADDSEYVLGDGATETLRGIFDGSRRGESFGNARFARTIFEQSLNAQALRLADGAGMEHHGPDALKELTAEDFAAAARALGEEPAQAGTASWFRRRRGA
jgi:hypothetical protein